MEFLKSCTTNICGTENILDTGYAIYEAQDAETDRIGLYARVGLLRAQGLLCSLVQQQIWVFGALDSEVTQLIEPQHGLWRVEAEDSICARPDALPADAATTRNILMDAMEGSIANSLSTIDGMVHIGPWKWLYVPAENAGNDIANVLFQLRAELTEMGALMIYTNSYQSCLDPLKDFGESQQATLAPSGQLGKTLDLSAQVKPEEFAAPSTVWKDMVASRLASEGIDLHTEEHWTAIELSDDQLNDYLWWPSRLCFTYAAENRLRTSSRPLCEWKHWLRVSPSLEYQNVFQNPLDFAEDWFVNASRRARAVDSAVDNSLDTTDSIAMSPLATSPPFTQRSADLQAAMLGIYPTPPDGMLPGPVPSLHTTTSDGLTDTLQAMDNSQFSDSADMHRLQAERTLSSDGASGFQTHNDDLFGDIGEIEFGPNEVGDADFDYFDEPDEVALLMDDGDDNIDMGSDVHLSESHAGPQQYDLPSASPTNALSSKSSPLQGDEALLGTPEIPTSTDGGDTSITSPLVVTQRRDLDPLSPFNIRERLLPPPVPASANQRPTKILKRSRTFGPMDFNEGMDFGGKPLYLRYNGKGSLEPGTLLHRGMNAIESPPVVASDCSMEEGTDVGSSDAESAKSLLDTSNLQEGVLPPALPWESVKRKREATSSGQFSSTQMPPGERSIATDLRSSKDLLLEAYGYMFSNDRRSAAGVRLAPWESWPVSSLCIADLTQSAVTLSSVDAFFQLTRTDLIMIAQVISEQAVSTNTSTAGSMWSIGSLRAKRWNHGIANLQALIGESIRHVVPEPEEYSVEKLLPSREGAIANVSNSRATVLGQNQQATAAAMQALPAVFSISAPYVRMQRGIDSFDVLPSALPFWQALGLGPASESKNIELVFVLPDGQDLPVTVENFVEDLRQAYEGCKLGTLSRAGVKGSHDGIVTISPAQGESPELAGILKAYAARCSELGRSLAEAEKRQPDQTTVVCLVNPFQDDPFALHYLCACFWLLYQAYRSATPNTAATRNHSSGDIVLQIVPISLIASPSKMVFLDAQQLADLAMEIYDRCPPSTKMIANNVESSTLPIFAAPALRLANFTHRRIGFQPTMEPPSDLLQEGSILHVAYALSHDEQWITICWIGSGGRSQTTMSLSMRGKSFTEIATRVWEQTLGIMAVRDVMWRVFLATTGNMDEAVDECWKQVVTALPRKQMLHVTLLALDIDPPAQFTPEQASENAKPAANVTTPGGGFLTPASTPQAAAFTVSPDASGATAAPLTPAPSDGTAGITESDPDAYLMDSADEAWGMLLSPSVASSSPKTSPASITRGLLLRRGNNDNDPLEALGVDLRWDIRIRPSGFVDDGPPRQIESNLREVLKLYRYLCLLTSIRGLQRHPSGGEAAVGRQMLIPIHAFCALQGSRALNGLIR